jgi:SPP1 family predicted phage head-tail adaptor
MSNLSISAGELDKRIKIQERTGDVNELNEPLDTWTTLRTEWAKIETLSGQEKMIANQTNASSTHMITKYFTSPLTTKMRIEFKGRFFDINSIENVMERNKKHVLIVQELQ